jgi:predicted adenine nucleotide alpha hydrolase (AANH) superfamily ATPase
MKILLHTCCGPCTIYPLQTLRDEGLEVMGFFYRNNIQPYRECLRRQETLTEFAAQEKLKLIVPTAYDMEGFLRNVAFREAERCRFCYHERLSQTARLALEGRFEAFTTTLLYSKYQKHELIRETGEAVARETGVPFYYQDFRAGWEVGVAVSRARGMYRQPYCGCIYSEKERYYRRPKDNPNPPPEDAHDRQPSRKP